MSGGLFAPTDKLCAIVPLVASGSLCIVAILLIPSLERTTAVSSEAARRERVDAVLYPVWGVTLEILAGYEAPANSAAYPTELNRIQPQVRQLIEAGIQPDELERALSWALGSPVSVCRSMDPLVA